MTRCTAPVWSSRKEKIDEDFSHRAKGQLGQDLMAELAGRRIEAVGVDVEDMDITDGEACRRVISREKPDAVIHCAAYTAVDAAEDNLELCRRVNAEGTRNIAKVCGDLECKMMYISTDYVFNGQGERPWEPDDPREPLNCIRTDKV